METSAAERPATPVAEVAVEVPMEAVTEGPATMAAAEAPAAGAVAKEAQLEPLLVGDAAIGASEFSELETKGEAGAREVEEEEDLFASGTDKGTDDALVDAAG